MNVSEWSESYRHFLRRCLVRVRGDACERCRAVRPRQLCLRVPPAVEVPHPTTDDARLLCSACVREADRETASGPAVRSLKRRDRLNGLADRDAALRWADDGGRVLA